MSLMLRIYLNNAYIGTLSESFAHGIAPVVCVNQGDVMTLETNDDDDSYYNEVTHTYYKPAGGGSVLCFDHTQYNVVQDEDEEEVRCNLSTYTSRLTGYKYDIGDARNRRHASGYITHVKRDMRRAERRVSKVLTMEQM